MAIFDYLADDNNSIYFKSTYYGRKFLFPNEKS